MLRPALEMQRRPLGVQISPLLVVRRTRPVVHVYSDLAFVDESSEDDSSVDSLDAGSFTTLTTSFRGVDDWEDELDYDVE